MTERESQRGQQEPMNIWVGGRYRMIKKIGEGAFGEIYLGDNPLTGQKVAIKLVLSPRARHRKTTNPATIFSLSRPIYTRR